jgi:hypothetical protein
VEAGLAYAKQGTKPYPKTSYPRIDRCAEIAGEEIACLATSWGLPQMMGFNHEACGYSSALDMVKAFSESEYNQVQAMVKFIQSSPKMLIALNTHNWAGFAKRYNGVGYAQNKYDQKLAKAYAYWKTMPLPKKIVPNLPRTPIPPLAMADVTVMDIDPPSVAIANMFAIFLQKIKGLFT